MYTNLEEGIGEVDLGGLKGGVGVVVVKIHWCMFGILKELIKCTQKSGGQ